MEFKLKGKKLPKSFKRSVIVFGVIFLFIGELTKQTRMLVVSDGSFGLFILSIFVVGVTVYILKMRRTKKLTARAIIFWITSLFLGAIMYGCYSGFSAYEMGRFTAIYIPYYVLISYLAYVVVDRGILRDKAEELEKKNLQS